MSGDDTPRRWLSAKSIALSISEPEDLQERGLSMEHLNDAFAELARQLLALGAQLIYGGDIREGGYTELLFELVARYGTRGEQGPSRPAVVNVLPYPVHAPLHKDAIFSLEARFSEIGGLVYLGRRGEHLSREERLKQKAHIVKPAEWADFLTAMRTSVTEKSDARVLLGGRRDEYHGRMPGLLEEALISNARQQPLFFVGGFGGITRDLAAYATIGSDFVAPGSPERHRFTIQNGLKPDELLRLARSPHIDEIAMLIVRGLGRMFAPGRQG